MKTVTKRMKRALNRSRKRIIAFYAYFCTRKTKAMNDFAAIDFETANGKRSSVCSVGVVIVRNGKTTETIYRLIRPAPNYYSYFCTAIHGLTDYDTKNAADFPAVWAEIAPKIAGLPLVAHNSPFDESCLRAAFKAYGMYYPDYTFHCTCRASRRTFGKQLPNHRLHTVAEYCGYDLQNHHNALADAEACAWIAKKLIFKKTTI
jgi:DNA polymerase-3 subunit epsilon